MGPLFLFQCMLVFFPFFFSMFDFFFFFLFFSQPHFLFFSAFFPLTFTSFYALVYYQPLLPPNQPFRVTPPTHSDRNFSLLCSPSWLSLVIYVLFCCLLFVIHKP